MSTDPTSGNAINCKASLRPTAWVLRLHEGGGYGFPYIGSATVLDRGDTAEIVGLTMQVAFTRTHREAVFSVLRENGYRHVLWERRSGNSLREVRVAL